MEIKTNYKVEFIDYGNKHIYRIIDNGLILEVPSVTHILSLIGGEKSEKLIKWHVKQSLSDFSNKITKFILDRKAIDEWTIQNLMADSLNAGANITKEKAEYGTDIHLLIDKVVKNIILNQPYDVQIEFQDIVNSFLNICNNINLQFLTGDTPVGSKKLKYGGRFDILGSINDALILIDIKTSKQIYTSHYLQVAGYAIAFEEMTNLPISLGGIIKLSEQPEYSIISLEKYKNCFKKLVEFYYAFLECDNPS